MGTSPAMIQLPNELLDEIVCNLSKADLKQARLACKCLAELATPLLFDTVVLAPKVKYLKYALLICQNFAPAIKTIIVSFEDFGHCAGVELDLGNHSRYCLEARKILETGEIGLFLRHLLDIARNVTRIVLTDWLPRKGFLTLDKRRAREAEENGFSMKTSRDRMGYFHDVLRDMGIAKSKVKELTIYLALPHRALSLSFEYQRYAEHVLQYLTKLTLTFRGREYESGTMGPDSHHFLARAVNLEALAINFNEYTMSVPTGIDDGKHQWFDKVLRGFPNPGLKTIVLRSCVVGAQELLDFLKRFKALENLVIEDCMLVPDMWRAFLDDIRTTFALKTIWINNIDRRIDRESEYIWQDVCNQIEPFFFNNGPNPFSDDMQKDYDAYWNILREWQKSPERKLAFPKRRGCTFDEHVRRIF